METKICRICGIEKLLTEYNKSGKYYRTECKECNKKIIKQWRKNNKQHIKEYSNKYHEENKELYKTCSKRYYENNKEEINKRRKIYRNNNKDKIQEHDKKYYQNNKEKVKLRTKKYKNIRRKNDALYKLKCNIRGMIYTSFYKKDYVKKEKTEKILGCSIEYFIKYLLETYKNNYGCEWNGIEKVHIDHIIPLAIANTEEEVMKLCNYKNLQLLKAKDNLEKSDKINFAIKGE